MALQSQGKLDEAINHYRRVLLLKPDFVLALHNLGMVLGLRGRPDEAISYYQRVLQINPNDAQTHKDLAIILLREGKLYKAANHYRQCLQINSDDADALNNLAWIFATAEDNKLRNSSDAVEFAQRACKLTDYKHPGLLDTLAVAYAAAGRFNQAIETAEKAIKLADSAGKKDLTDKIQSRLQLYQAGQAYRQKQP